MRALLSSLTIALLLSACGTAKECEQPTEVTSQLENRTGATQELSFEYWSDHLARVETKTITLQGLSLERAKIEDSKYTKQTHYQGKIAFKGEDPVCTATPEARSTSLYLSAASFLLVKACRPKLVVAGGLDIIITDKNDSCPADTIEQRRAGYPNGSTAAAKPVAR